MAGPEISIDAPVADVAIEPPAPAPTVPAGLDLPKIDRNLGRLVKQGAPDADIHAYLQSEGVTPEQVLESKGGMLRRAGEAIAGAAGAVKEAFVGKQDPAFAGVPGFSAEGISDPKTLSAIKRGRIVTMDDAAYGDVLRKSLGDRFVKSQKDVHGQEIITYRDDEGGEKRAYVNKPGLDVEDVSRTVESSVPFLVTGGIAGGIVKGLPLLGRLAVQAATAFGTSVGMDVAAKGAGSEQGIDLPRAGFAAGGAAVGEALSPMIAATWRKLVTGPGMVDDAGRLTAAGRAKAAASGLSADDIARLESGKADDFAAAAAYGRDPKEVAAQVRTGEFEIPTTKGQRTKDPRMLQMEVEMRKGLWGDRAKNIIDEFDKSQTQAIGGAVETKIGRTISENAPGMEKPALGASVQDGLRAARAYADEAENQIWGAAGPMFPREEGFDLLAGRVARSLQDSAVWPKPNLGAYKSSNEMLQFLEDYSKGKVLEQELPLIGKGRSSIFLDDARRYLLNLYRGAEPRTADAKAAKAIYDGFNTWIDDLADNAMLVGQPDAAAALKTARAFTKDMKQLFAPRDVGGRPTPAGRRLETVFDRADSPESVIDALVPQPSTKLRVGDVDALKAAKDILVNNGAPEAWDDLRLAYWVKIAQNEKGQIHSPKLLRNRIDAAFTNQKTALDVMFDADEQSLMKRFAGALDEATWVDPNPSGTSYALKSMNDRFGGGSTIKTLLQTQSKRELFSKHNVLASRIYQILARKVPVSVFGSKEGAGAAAAGRATSQELTPTRPPSFGGLGGAVGAEIEAE